MSEYLIKTKGKHTCESCGKAIRVGGKAVKFTPAKVEASATEIYSLYFHEKCWPPQKRR